MSTLTREDLRNQLRRREIAPVYILFGPETYLRDLAARTIADFVLKEAPLRDFNENEFSLNISDNIHQALAAADQLPMMAPRRVIRITDVRISATSGRDTLKDEHEEAMTRYLSRPAESSVLIFIADDFDKRRKISKLFIDKAVAVEFKRLEEAELLQWARDKVREAGFDADEKALRQLIGLTGEDLRRLTNEIAKVSTASLPGKLISYETVDALVPNSREISNFDLMDHLIAKEKRMALTVLRKILNDGGEPLMILGLIANSFHRLLMAKSMMEQGGDRSEVGRILKIPYRKQGDFLAAARRAETAAITRIMKRLAETDLSIKTSKGGGGTIGAKLQIEVLVCELVNS
jgi:DNA polymerase III subunit delta